MSTIKNDFNGRKKQDVSPLVYGKIPPQAADIEEAVLGAIMLETDAFERVMEIIHSPECFYIDAHQKIYRAMCELYNNEGMPVDLLTITEQLRKNGELEVIGGAYFLTKLTMSVMSSANVEAHAAIIMDKYCKRELIRIAGATINDCFNDEQDFFEIKDELDKEYNELDRGISTDNFENVGKIFIDVLMGIEEQKQRKSELLGVDTGYVELNRVILGMCPGDLILIAARPSEGKTALLLNLLYNAITSKISPAGECLLFSIESSKTNLGRRYAASVCDVPLEAIRMGNTNEIQDTLLRNKVSEFNRLNIKIDDKTQELTKIVASIRRHYKKYKKTLNGKKGLPFIVGIDYLQLVNVKDAKTEEQQVSAVSKMLKRLSIELDIIIIPLVQLNREVTKRGSNRPKPSDMRYSGQLEQDAQIIIMIWHEEKEAGAIDTHLLVAKNKDGNTGDVLMKFNGDIQRWINYDDMNQGRLPSYLTRNPSEPTKPGWDFDQPF